jgi:hypothetical protein
LVNQPSCDFSDNQGNDQFKSILSRAIINLGRGQTPLKTDFIIYPTCIDLSDKQQFAKKYMQTLPKSCKVQCAQGILLCGNEVSHAFIQTWMGVFMKNMRKCSKEILHDQNDDICRVIKISDHKVLIRRKPSLNCNF